MSPLSFLGTSFGLCGHRRLPLDPGVYRSRPDFVVVDVFPLPFGEASFPLQNCNRDFLFLPGRRGRGVLFPETPAFCPLPRGGLVFDALRCSRSARLWGPALWPWALPAWVPRAGRRRSLLTRGGGGWRGWASLSRWCLSRPVLPFQSLLPAPAWLASAPSRRERSARVSRASLGLVLLSAGCL